MAEGPNKPLNNYDFLEQEFEIREVQKHWYYKLSQFHYVNVELPSVVRKVFGLFHKATGILYGAIVYSAPSLEITARNKTPLGAALKRVKNRSERYSFVNKWITYVSRIVIHPSLRGIGAASYLIENTWRKAGTRFVEMMGTMMYYSNFLPKSYAYYFKVEKELPQQDMYPKPTEKAAMQRRLKSPIMRYGYALFIAAK